MELPQQKSLIDIHIHAPPLPEVNNPNLLIKYLKWRLGIRPNDPDPMKTYLDGLVNEIRNSQYIARGVLLAMDGVYDRYGEFDKNKTHFMVMNDSVFKAVSGYNELLAGASINPQRKDAIDELARCKELGAALIKTLPNSQCFNPLEKRFIPFYKKLAELKMPLLSHTGYEFVISMKNQAYGNPALLKTALDQGVIVIAAHGGSAGLFVYERYFDTIKELVKNYPSFFLDVSAMTLPTRAGMLLKIRNEVEIKERLIFGSDYPLPSFSFPFMFSVSRDSYSRIKKESNYFDKLVYTFSAMGIGFNPACQRIIGN